MKNRIAILSALMMCATLVAAPKVGHTQQGVSYKNVEYKGHGPDGELFLDPYLKSELANVTGNVVLDAGCGTAPWAIEAAQNGAKVCGIDSQQSMLDKAQVAIARAGVESQVQLCQGDVVNLPYEAAQFDKALSINVGCNLNRTMQVITQDHYAVTGLGGHFREIARVLKEGGELVIAAPASLDVVFTDGGHSQEEAMANIKQALAKIGSSNNPEVITKNLLELEGVQRATFVKRGDQLVLVTSVKDLTIGEPIWRKIPGAVLPNYYHSEEEYLVAIRNAGLFCEEVKRPCFFGNVKYKAYRNDNDALGEAYIHNNPFTIYYVKKQA